MTALEVVMTPFQWLIYIILCMILGAVIGLAGRR